MKKQPPIVPVNEAEPLQDFYDDGSARWSVARLIDDCKDLEPFDAPLAALDLSHVIWEGADMTSLAFHCKKVNASDLKKPIIIAWDGNIADGRHRIIKSLMLGKRTIKAVRMTWKPSPCSVHE